MYGGSLDDLEQLHQSVIDPAWSQSAIWPLVGPLVDYFTKEVESRRDICEVLEDCVQGLPEVGLPDSSDDGGPLMAEEYVKLGKAFRRHERCRIQATSFPSIAELKVWHGTSESRLVTNYDSHSKAARVYRQSVLQQQRIYTKERLEAHQQQSEDIKTAVNKILTSNRQDGTQRFSSSEFISEVYECYQLEACHLWMQPVGYVDFETAEFSDTVIFGTDRGMEIMYTLLGWVLGGVMSFRKLEIHQAPSKKKMIELEQRFQLAGNVNDMLSLSQPPLVPLDNKEIKRYSKSKLLPQQSALNSNASMRWNS
ncbi:14334_t:CDS:2 [Acaulospora colombiana]|uniref:14334_t:CDS:1 n=1 Tax=Acaulospora colombiana TaxID=27376 RepID=A0ACA9NYF4_9GLOM|nr:14334_t:CDS:2 [Acaulospora colombiana]